MTVVFILFDDVLKLVVRFDRLIWALLLFSKVESGGRERNINEILNNSSVLEKEDKLIFGGTDFKQLLDLHVDD